MRTLRWLKRHVVEPVSRTFTQFGLDDGYLLAAGVAYYVGLTLFPILWVLIGVLGALLRLADPNQDARDEVLRVVAVNASPEVAQQVGEVLAPFERIGAPGGLIGIAIVGILILGWWVVTKKCPPADYPFSLKRFESDPVEEGHLIPAAFTGWKRYINPAVLEKILMLSLVSFIFSKMLPGVNATAAQVTINVFILVVANAFVSEVLRHRGIVAWDGALIHFAGVLLVNAGIALVMRYILPIGDSRLDLVSGNLRNALDLLRIRRQVRQTLSEAVSGCEPAEPVACADGPGKRAA